MKVVLNTYSSLAAAFLHQGIIRSLKDGNRIESLTTWSYVKSKEQYDIIYHNPDQYVNEPDKNVIFRIYVDGSDVVFLPMWWMKNPRPTEDMICLHVGRLVEMLMRYFSAEFKTCVIDKA